MYALLNIHHRKYNEISTNRSISTAYWILSGFPLIFVSHMADSLALIWIPFCSLFLEDVYITTVSPSVEYNLY